MSSSKEKIVSKRGKRGAAVAMARRVRAKPCGTTSRRGCVQLRCCISSPVESRPLISVAGSLPMATERTRRAVTQSLRVLSLKAVLTMFFLLIIMGATDSRAPHGFAPIAIGLGLTLIHLVGIPVTNLSVNPARSTAPALFVGGWALRELWMFWVAPLLGGALGGALYTILFSEVKLSAPISVGAPTIPRSKAEA
jgi:hypothetical protein